MRLARLAVQEACIRELSETRTAELGARQAALVVQCRSADAAGAEERACGKRRGQRRRPWRR